MGFCRFSANARAVWLRHLMVAGLLCSGLLLLVPSGAGVARADTIHVPADQPTIQAGINAAVADDIVLVAPGSYSEKINFLGKAITVRSSGGPGVTTINAIGQADTAVLFNTSETAASVLEGFTIINGTGRSVPLPPLGSAMAGGGIFIDGASPTIIDCIIENHNVERGAALYCSNGEPTIVETQFLNNIAQTLGGAIWMVNSTAAFEHCTFQGNSTTTAGSNTRGGAAAVSGGQSSFTNCDFLTNTSAGHAGAMLIENSNGTLDGCVFLNNDAALDGGAMFVDGQNKPLVKNSRFLGNEANAAGALHVQVFTSPFRGVTNAQFVNNVFAGNIARGIDLPLSSKAGGGAVVVSVNGRINFTNCTFHANRLLTDVGRGGGISIIQGATDIQIVNSIFWAHFAPVAANVAARQIYVAPAFSGGFNVTYSCIEDEVAGDGNIPFGGAANHNIDALPAFSDASGPDGINGTLDDDLSLTADSPCRDTGDNAAPDLAGIDVDIIGNSRIIGLIVDMGAYEYKPPCRGDANEDNLVNVLDLLIVIANWGSVCAPGEDCPGDVTDDGIVNVQDLLEVIANWGADCSEQ